MGIRELRDEEDIIKDKNINPFGITKKCDKGKALLNLIYAKDWIVSNTWFQYQHYTIFKDFNTYYQNIKSAISSQTIKFIKEQVIAK